MLVSVERLFAPEHYSTVYHAFFYDSQTMLFFYDSQTMRALT